MTQMNCISIVSSTRTHANLCQSPEVSPIWMSQDRKINPRRPSIKTNNTPVYAEATLDSGMQGSGYLPTPQSCIPGNTSHTAFTWPPGAPSALLLPMHIRLANYCFCLYNT